MLLCVMLFVCCSHILSYFNCVYSCDIGSFCVFFFLFLLFFFCFFCLFVFFFQAEDGIRDRDVTGVQTCALPSGWWWCILFLVRFRIKNSIDPTVLVVELSHFHST